MYVESEDKDAVESWVGVVRDLRYKDFQLVSRPACAVAEGGEANSEDNGKGKGKGKEKGKGKGKDNRGGHGKGEGDGQKDGKEVEVGAGLEEVDSVKEFGSFMAQRGVWQWWRKGMGYVH